MVSQDESHLIRYTLTLTAIGTSAQRPGCKHCHRNSRRSNQHSSRGSTSPSNRKAIHGRRHHLHFHRSSSSSVQKGRQCSWSRPYDEFHDRQGNLAITLLHQSLLPPLWTEYGTQYLGQKPPNGPMIIDLPVPARQVSGLDQYAKACSRGRRFLWSLIPMGVGIFVALLSTVRAGRA
jgi:hypothetical protein